MKPNDTTEFMEYNDFNKLLQSSKPQHLYEELINKEERLLQTLNRVVDYSNRKELEAKEFLHTPVKDVAKGFMASMLELFEGLFKVKTPEQLVALFIDADRIIYFGIFIIVFSVILFFLNIA
jgi:hypothetical protein